MKIVNLRKICDQVIEYFFYLLFFLIPLIMTPWNFELFEYNKVMLTYALTIVIVGSWLIKMIIARKLIFQRTPFDVPLLLFLLSQILSTIFSIDRHTSIWGYYSRFHGGLLSTISYLLLYYAFVSNFNKQKVFRALIFILASALLVSLYGILEHPNPLGGYLAKIEKHCDLYSPDEEKCIKSHLVFPPINIFFQPSEYHGVDYRNWVQEVEERVFSTLGQPNWLAAWIAALLPLTLVFTIASWRKSKKTTERNLKFLLFSSLTLLLSLCLFYTRSRSGIAAAFFSLGLFLFLNIWPKIFLRLKGLGRSILISLVILILASGVLGGKLFWQKNQSDLAYIFGVSNQIKITPQPLNQGSESTDIRKIVWRGAVDIGKHYPLFGSGVETFAYSYYQFRPVEHNLVSEWDFLYNKAHNEYLNFWATTGTVGLGSYLLLIGWIIFWFTKKILGYKETRILSGKKSQVPNILISQYLNLAIFSGWLSILITNFFGFSVVPIALLFFLFPAMSIVLSKTEESKGAEKQYAIRPPAGRAGNKQYAGIIFVLSSIFYLLFSISKFWLADVAFAKGYQLNKQLEAPNNYLQAFQTLQKAIKLNSGEPNYYDEFSWSAANLVVLAFGQEESSLSANLASLAISSSDKATTISPKHLNFWKTKAKVFLKLSQADQTFLPKFLPKVLEALQTAHQLAPTDTKILYNLALVQETLGQNSEAIETLQKTIQMKPNYEDAHYALALLYQQNGQRQQAIEQLEYILKFIQPGDTEVLQKLNEVLTIEKSLLK